MKALKGARQIAWELIYSVEAEGAYSNIALPNVLRNSGLEDRDRAFTTELVYGTIRMRGFCDAAIRKYSDRPIEDIDLKVLITLRLGAYQLLILKSPPHAAIYETVELAKQVNGRSASSFVNAVLRRISENLEFQPEDLEDRFSHPKWIINAFRDVLKDEQDVISQLQADNSASSPTIVSWPGRSEADELIAAGASRMENGRNAFTFKGNPAEIPAIRERRAGVQDLGSQLIVERFFETGGGRLRWLDLCAGPGGKAAYLDALISDGELVANEPAPERLRLLSQVLRRARAVSFDGRNPPEDLGKFDRILVDAPCTGLGALRRRPEVRWRRSAGDLRGLIQLQEELLDGAASILEPGGVIGYATCSPHIAETKLQVASFLRRNPNFHRKRIEINGDIDGDMQLWTFRDGTDAMFLSLLEKEK